MLPMGRDPTRPMTDPSPSSSVSRRMRDGTKSLARWARVPRHALGIGLIVWASFALLSFLPALHPWGDAFYSGDVVTPPSGGNWHAYLLAFSTPWNPQPAGGTFEPFFTNDLLLGAALGGLGVALGSAGEGAVALLLLTEAGLGLSFYLSARHLGIPTGSAGIASLAFALSPWVFNRFVAGHENILLAYLLFPPFLAVMGTRVLGPEERKATLLALVLLGGVGFLEYHLFYLAALAWLAFVILRTGLIWIRHRRSSKAGSPRPWRPTVHGFLGDLIILAGAVGLNLVWVWPAAEISRRTGQAGVQVATIANTLAFTQGQLTPWNLLSGNGYFSPAYDSAWAALAAPAAGPLAAGALSVVLGGALLWGLLRGDPQSRLFGLLSLPFLLLSAGTLALGPIYLQLVAHVPLFAVNDDPNKFDVVALPALAFLLGKGLPRWTIRAPGNPLRGRTLSPRLPSSPPALPRVWGVACVVIVLVGALPFAAGSLGGEMIRAPPVTPLAATASELAPPGGRIALFPPDPAYFPAPGKPATTDPFVVYPSADALYIPLTTGVEAEGPTLRSVLWTYESFYQNETSHAPSLFGLLGTGLWMVAPNQSVSHDIRYRWDSPENLTRALAAQADLPPGFASGGDELYRTNDTPGILTATDRATVALANREFLLEAGYLPGGPGYLRNDTVAFLPGGPLPPQPLWNLTVETPGGWSDALFQSLPPGDLVSVAPAAWNSLGTSPFLPTTPGVWLPWEAAPQTEAGIPLAAWEDWARSTGGAPLQVPLSSPTAPGATLFAEVFFGPQEGELEVSLGSQTFSVDAWSPVPLGFRWVPLGVLTGSASVATLLHTGPGESTVATLAWATPSQIDRAAADLSAALAPVPGGGPTAIYQIKGSLATSSGGWSQWETGAEMSQGWGGGGPAGSSASSRIQVLRPGPLGATVRAQGNGTLGISLCPDPGGYSDPTPAAPCPGPVNVTAAIRSGTPEWYSSVGSLASGIGSYEVSLRVLSGNVTVDLVDLVPATSGSPLSELRELLASGQLETGTVTSGSPGSMALSLELPPEGGPRLLVDRVPASAGWSAHTAVGLLPSIVVDGWATAFVVPPGSQNITIGLPWVQGAFGEGILGSLVTLLLLAVWFVAPALVAFIIRTRGGRRPIPVARPGSAGPTPRTPGPGENTGVPPASPGP